MILVGEFGEVEGDVALAGFRVLAVAIEAVLREDGANVLVVGDWFFGLEGQEEEGEEETFWHEEI